MRKVITVTIAFLMVILSMTAMGHDVAAIAPEGADLVDKSGTGGYIWQRGEFMFLLDLDETYNLPEFVIDEEESVGYEVSTSLINDFSANGITLDGTALIWNINNNRWEITEKTGTEDVSQYIIFDTDGQLNIYKSGSIIDDSTYPPLYDMGFEYVNTVVIYSTQNTIDWELSGTTSDVTLTGSFSFYWRFMNLDGGKPANAFTLEGTITLNLLQYGDVDGNQINYDLDKNVELTDVELTSKYPREATDPSSSQEYTFDLASAFGIYDIDDEIMEFKVSTGTGNNNPFFATKFFIKTMIANVDYEEPSVTDVEIDIRPGNDKNQINLKSNGVVPVAVFSSNDFDATTIDADTVRFGPGEAELHGKMHKKDVDKDGDLDAVFKFKVKDCGFVGDKGDKLPGTITGSTSDEIEFEGTDVVLIK